MRCELVGRDGVLRVGVINGTASCDGEDAVCRVAAQFGSELWSGPEPDRTRPRFGPGSGVGAELEQWFMFGFGVAPNLAESFGTGSEPRTRSRMHGEHIMAALWDLHHTV